MFYVAGCVVEHMYWVAVFIFLGVFFNVAGSIDEYNGTWHAVSKE